MEPILIRKRLSVSDWKKSFFHRFRFQLGIAFLILALVLAPLVPVPWNNLDWAPTSEEWQAYASVLGVLLTAIAATIALVQLYSHLNAIDDTRRPYVIADFHFRGGALAFVEISNISANPAYGVTLETDHIFEIPRTEDSDRINEHFSSPEKSSNWQMPLLAPGRSVLYSLGSIPEIISEKLRTEYVVMITYHDQPLGKESGMRAPHRFLDKPRRTWTEPNPLSLAQWASTIAERDEYHWKRNESAKYLKHLATLNKTQSFMLREYRSVLSSQSNVPQRKISTNRRIGLRKISAP